MFVAGQAQKHGTEQGATSQVENMLCFLLDQLLYLLFAFLIEQRAQINEWQEHAFRGMNDLHRLALRSTVRCAQDFVSLDNLAQAACQGLYMQPALQV